MIGVETRSNETIQGFYIQAHLEDYKEKCSYWVLKRMSFIEID